MRSSSRSMSRSGPPLEDILSLVMSERVESLAGLRSKIEELALLQQEETERFISSMRNVFEQSRAARVSATAEETELADQLEREREERRRAVEIATRFRKEGASVMSQLKDSLHQLQQQHAKTVAENRELKARLTDDSAPSSKAVNDGRVAALTQLLDEQDAVVQRLQQRRKHVEQRLNDVTRERDRLLHIEPGDVPEHLLHEFARMERLGGTTMSTAHLRELVASLMKRLKAEQSQRLRVEEQAARITAAQDQSLRRLEARVRELEGGSSARADASGAATPKSTAASSRPLQVPKLTATPSRPTPPVEAAVPANSAGASRSTAVSSSSAGAPAKPSQADADRQGTPPVPSLEVQLQAVSAEFQESLQQWQRVVAQDAEFLPDSP